MQICVVRSSIRKDFLLHFSKLKIPKIISSNWWQNHHSQDIFSFPSIRWALMQKKTKTVMLPDFGQKHDIFHVSKHMLHDLLSAISKQLLSHIFEIPLSLSSRKPVVVVAASVVEGLCRVRCSIHREGKQWFDYSVWVCLSLLIS